MIVMNKIANRIVLLLIESNYIDPMKKQIYLYGMQTGLEVIFNIIISILIMMWHRKFIFSIAFLITLSLIRFYTGGLHFDSFIMCTVVSSVCFFIVVQCSDYILKIRWLIMLLIATGVVLLISPLRDENRPLSNLEIVIFKRRRNIILGILYCILFTAYICKISVLICAIVWAVSIDSLTLFCGYAYNKAKQRIRKRQLDLE